MARRITAIPATVGKFTAQPTSSTRKRRVAGYARVSTESDEQATSYAAQVDYYTRYISSRADWEFAGLYADEGLSGTSTKKRDGFNKMIADALAGKIDLIITKSVSRFARNTVDSLSTIRKLKENHIECYFEKENIWTFDSKGELLITIMSSLAQEESRSISENTTWGKRKQFADGKVSIAYSTFLGYDKGADGNLVINEEQAKTVRLIYDLFLSGLTPHTIAKELMRRGIKTPTGKEKWHQSSVDNILANEKYMGDVLLQKTYTTDFLTHKSVRNEGQVPQYYIHENHPFIIEPEKFAEVQAEIKRRKESKSRYSGVGMFSSKIRCGECGGWFGAKVWHSTDKYRRTVYRCNRKYGSGKKCDTPHICEDEIKAAFVKAANKLLGIKEEVIANIEIIRKMLCDTAELEQTQQTLEQEMSVLAEMAKNCITENASAALDQTEYQKRYNDIAGRYEKAKADCEAVKSTIAERGAKSKRLDKFVRTLKEQNGLLLDFEDCQWIGLVEYITVYAKDDIRVTFRDGTEIKA